MEDTAYNYGMKTKTRRPRQENHYLKSALSAEYELRIAAERQRDEAIAALREERRRCAQIVVDCFAPSQGEDMDPSAVEALAIIKGQP